ncbi:MAG: hypothetical protein ACSLFP_02235 [Acidimicrobiales bacterium]
MRKTALLIAAWFGAGVLAVTTASIGVSMVSQQVTGDRPAPLSATEVREELAAAAATAGSGSSTTSVVEPTEPTAPDVTAAAAPTPAAPPSTEAPRPRVAPSPPTPTTTPPAPAGAETRTYSLIGGTATLRFTPAGVTVVTAIPKAGFSVKVEPEHGNGVQVEFESDDHRSRVDASWANGPVDEVREDD